MDEHVVPGRVLDKAVAFRGVEPLYCTFFFHRPSPEKSFRRRAGPQKRKSRVSAAPFASFVDCRIRTPCCTASAVSHREICDFNHRVYFDLRDERAVTERLRKAAVIPAGSPLILGIGDDCAIYRPRGSADDLLFTADMFIEGVHFLRETHKAPVAGRKALVRSLSDIAAMGGSPRFCLVSLCVPAWANERWIDGFFDG